MSRRLGDDPLARKKDRGKGGAVVVPQPAVGSPSSSSSSSYNKVFFERKPESEIVEEIGSDVEVDVGAAPQVESAPPTEPAPPAPGPIAPAETPPRPFSWTAQLVESIAAPAAPVTLESIAPAPVPAGTDAQEEEDQGEAQQGGGFFKRLLGRLQR